MRVNIRLSPAVSIAGKFDTQSFHVKGSAGLPRRAAHRRSKFETEERELIHVGRCESISPPKACGVHDHCWLYTSSLSSTLRDKGVEAREGSVMVAFETNAKNVKGLGFIR